METGQPSRTAENTAVMRALHQALPPGSRVFDDPIATRLVHPDSEAYRSRVSLLESLSDSVRSRFTHFIMRSRYTEDCLAEAVQHRGLIQYVIRGAGLDTFAYRQPSWGTALRIFEVDHPATRSWKRQRLEDVGIAVPKNAHFAPIDFTRTTLADGLSRAGFSRSEPTFFSMLGVSQYLPSEALDQTFKFVLTMPRSSEIVFTVVVPDEVLPPDDAVFTLVLTKRFAAIGEPWLTRVLPEQFAQKLKSMGFPTVTYLPSADADRLYFQNRIDGLRASKMELMMRATV